MESDGGGWWGWWGCVWIVAAGIACVNPTPTQSLTSRVPTRLIAQKVCLLKSQCSNDVAGSSCFGSNGSHSSCGWGPGHRNCQTAQDTGRRSTHLTMFPILSTTRLFCPTSNPTMSMPQGKACSTDATLQGSRTRTMNIFLTIAPIQRCSISSVFSIPIFVYLYIIDLIVDNFPTEIPIPIHPSILPMRILCLPFD